MSGNNEINIGTQYSKYPAGRTYGDGPFSGERFRAEFLEPRLKANQKTRILFDDALGCGSSFLEEAFGGLVRAGYTEAQLLACFELVTSDDVLKGEILQYIREENERTHGGR